ncbi:MAG: FAD-dependent oxidoreductase [Planctomycetaceae bacterium]|nr:FAD-dependent oxidoreductase [Planctomycetaceae bacterium]
MKIAIIGSGISGLTCAYLLSREHEVTLFEANDYPGGHTRTVDVKWQGESQAIDCGFIVYNERTYPHFIGLLEELEVETQPTEMGFSVSCRRTGFEYNGTNLLGLIADKRNLISPRFYNVLLDILRFYRDTRHFLEDKGRSNSELTVGEFVRQQRYSQDFLHYHLMPMGAAIWSCSFDSFADFPFRFVARFYNHHGLIQVTNRPVWRVIKGGSRCYVERMLAAIGDRLRLNTPVARVERHANGPVVHFQDRSEVFDHVIFACHADIALKLLPAAQPEERELLQQFRYVNNTATIHTDASLLPHSRNAWASWNYTIDPEQESYPTLTYYMNKLQGLNSRHSYCVTLNSSHRIDPAKVLGEFNFAHPVFSTSRDLAQLRHAEMIGRSGISYCGAYWRNGFHEDGVVSALRVCRQWGISPNWSQAPIEADV